MQSNMRNPMKEETAQSKRRKVIRPLVGMAAVVASLALGVAPSGAQSGSAQGPFSFSYPAGF
jgi:hypothetical protein